MNAYGYIRVSTEEQTKGYSLEAQEKAIRDYCKLNNINLIKIFEDHTSGAKIDRPELQSLLNEIEHVDMVVVWKMDRLSRSVKDTLKIMEVFEKKEKELISLTEPFLSIRGDSQSKLMLHIFSSFAQYERDLIRERMIMGKLQKAKKGLVPAGKAPYGYRYKDHSYEIVEEEAKVVRLIFNKYIEYKSISKVVDYLNKNMYKTPTGKNWTHSLINNMLRNQIYKGTYIYNKRTSIKEKNWIKPESEWIVIEKPQWAIIDEETFNKAQEILRINSTKKEKSSNRLGTGVSLFGGILECGICGRSMVIKSSKRKTPYYRCKSYDERLFCGNEFAYEPFIEEGAVEIIEKLANMSKNEIYMHIISQLKDNEIENQLKQLEKEEKQIKKVIDRFTQEFEYFLIEGKDIPVSLREKLHQYEQKLKKLQQTKEKILYEYQKQEKAILEWDEFINMLKQIRTILNIAERDDKKLLYRAVFDKIIFTPGNVIAYVKGKEFKLKYHPRILKLTEADKKILQQINTIRSKIVLMAGETADKNEIAKRLNVDQYLIDYCINSFKKKRINLLKIDKPNSYRKSKHFNDVKNYIEKNQIDINSISARSLYQKFKEETKIDIKESAFRNILYKLGKVRNRKF